MITKKFLTTKDDIASYYKTIFVKNSVAPSLFIIMLFVVVGIFKLMNVSGELKMFAIFIVPIVTIATIVITPYSIAKKMLAQNVFLKHDIFVELSEDGMKQEIYNSNSFLKWTDAYNYFESKKIFAIFISEQQAYIVPKRIFARDEIENISKILKDSIILPKNNKKKKILIGIGIYVVLFIVITIAMMFLTQRT